jgi:site-specific recombinase XerD
MQELDAIKNHHIRTHTIIIDDLRCWTIATHGFDAVTIMNKILTINSVYKFIYSNGHVENDILIAKINEKINNIYPEFEER